MPKMIGMTSLNPAAPGTFGHADRNALRPIAAPTPQFDGTGFGPQSGQVFMEPMAFTAVCFMVKLQGGSNLRSRR